MKIVTGRTMAEIDRTAIRERGIPSLALMERAGRAASRHFHQLCGDPHSRVAVLCGTGNNGGDGFVVARRLLGWGYRPRVVMTSPPEKLSPDSRTNFDRYRPLPFADWSIWGDAQSDHAFEGNPVVVDALLGTGARGAPRLPISEIISRANESACWALGVDIASGVDADTGEVCGEAMACRSTLTFGLPKVGHFRGGGIDYTGTLSVADIGFPKDVTDSAPSEADLITLNWVREHIPRYPRSVFKGDRGKVLILAGSAPMLGAAILCARAALKTGAGLVTLALPESLNAAVKGALPEAMTLPLPDDGTGRLVFEATASFLEFAESADAVAIGPGLGRTDDVRKLIHSVVEKIDRPLVLDADGLYAMSDETGKRILTRRKTPTVLTPHVGEFLRLSGDETQETLQKDSWGACRNLADSLGVTVLLKGPATLVAEPNRPLKVNRTGSPAMSQGGMGDVLTGVIATLLGEGLTAGDAAAAGAHIHGRAGEWAFRESRSRTVSASEAIDHLANVFREVG